MMEWSCLLLMKMIFLTATLVADAGKPPPLGGGSTYKFPDGFLVGAGTSAYQVEGARNKDGKGDNIWDYMLDRNPEYVVDRSNGDVAARSYDLYREDVRLLKKLNAKVYSFSIAWSRVLTNGDLSTINKAGIAYYDKLIDELLANGIQPVVTIHKTDLPQYLQFLGGWPNPFIQDFYVEYARLLFRTYGDRVKYWVTFSSSILISEGYTFKGFIAPSQPGGDYGGYWATYNIQIAHAKTYRMYHKEFAPSQKGKVGFAILCPWLEPETNSPQEIADAEFGLQFRIGLLANPIFSPQGDYPQAVKKRVIELSKRDGQPRSRLPLLNEKEIQLLRGTADFFGVNYYNTSYVTSPKKGVLLFRFEDPQVYVNDTAFGGYSNAPGLRKLLNWLNREYPGFSFLITQNGYASRDDTLQDDDRVEYHLTHLAATLEAIDYDGIDVLGYVAWSLLDHFVWNEGYTQKYGLYRVDFKDPRRTRTPRASARVLSGVYGDCAIPIQYMSKNYAGGKKKPPRI